MVSSGMVSGRVVGESEHACENRGMGEAAKQRIIRRTRVVRTVDLDVARLAHIEEHKVLLEARQALLLTRDVLADSRGSGQEKKQRSAVPKGRGRYLKDTFAKLARRTADPSATSAKQRTVTCHVLCSEKRLIRLTF